MDPSIYAIDARNSNTINRDEWYWTCSPLTQWRSDKQLSVGLKRKEQNTQHATADLTKSTVSLIWTKNFRET